MNKLYIHIFQRVRNTFHTTNGMNKTNLKHCENITREILKANLNENRQNKYRILSALYETELSKIKIK